MHHVTGLDHMIVLVDRLEAARAHLESLGFVPAPRGAHSPHMGTANYTVMFPDRTYFEVLGITAATDRNAAMRRRLAVAGNGPFGLALRTDDARAAARALADAGVGDGDAVDFARAVDMPDGRREARFTTAYLAPDATPGVKSFVCQHYTPELVWREDCLEHPNGIVGVAGLVGAASDLDAAAAAYARAFGERVVRDGDSVRIELGNASVELLDRARFLHRYGAMPASDPGIAVLRLRSRSLGLTRRFMPVHHAADGGSGATLRIQPPSGGWATILDVVEG
ncbi:MAG: VOC family protein [Ectothiorhodospiraceae bacterium]|nr:VOC family protein [Chromatiales bacterium]MCP5155526.1 VOC family protein [Ectothiorhodospiraceae bacterium]